jgi:hypothetical protein
MKSTTLALASTLIASTTAVPAVVPIPVAYPGTCTSWPNWINSRGSDVTGALGIRIHGSTDGSISDLPLHGFESSFGSSPRAQLGADFRPRALWGASSYIRCQNGKITYGNDNVTISTNSRAAQLLVAPQEPTIVAELYYLEVVGGKRLDGVFLGAKNQTTWGFYHAEPTCKGDGKSSRDFLGARLLGLEADPANPPTAEPQERFEGWLQVVPA